MHLYRYCTLWFLLFYTLFKYPQCTYAQTVYGNNQNNILFVCQLQDIIYLKLVRYDLYQIEALRALSK